MKLPSHFPQEGPAIWKSFYQITQIPRPSGHEGPFRDFLTNLATSKGLELNRDEKGNVVIHVPGKNGKENSPVVIIQNHMDMVCDTVPGLKFDFIKDPIETIEENGWIKAVGTTLGADNGIGCAAALALIEADIPHPPLELLFTVEEETGLFGASALDSSLLSGKTMLNLDTEEWGSVYVGCAGGLDYELTKKVKRVPLTKSKILKLTVDGLCGGHSGIDIHRGRGNASKLLAELLTDLKQTDFELVEFRGGKAHNIIPRDAFAIIALDNLEELESIVTKKISGFKTFLPSEDHNVSYSIESVDAKTCLETDARDQFLTILNVFPHGAHSFNWESDEPLVNLSDNLAKVLLVDENFYIQTSLRFFDSNELISLKHKVQSIASDYNFELNTGCGYPAWKPQFHGELLDLVKDVFQVNYGFVPEVKAVHAGLECGILKEKIGAEVDVVSFGPEITGAHSPSESLEIESTNKFWDLLVKIMARL